MSFDHIVAIVSAVIALFAAVISFASVRLFVRQLREGDKDRKLGSQIRLYDINREILSLGFDHPELFGMLTAKPDENPKERRYLQLWLNQLALVHSMKLQGAFEPDVQESFETDFRDVMAMPNMQRHWHEFRKYYPASFQEYVNHTLHEAGHDPKHTIKR
jgi:hypothetical protein